MILDPANDSVEFRWMYSRLAPIVFLGQDLHTFISTLYLHSIFIPLSAPTFWAIHVTNLRTPSAFTLVHNRGGGLATLVSNIIEPS